MVLLHEGGAQAGSYNDCDGISGPIVAIAENLDPAIDVIVTGHTHRSYVCDIPDPNGESRYVTSAESFGRLITETNLIIDPESRDVLRDSVTSTNHVVTQDVAADPAATAVLDKWGPLAEEQGQQKVGEITDDITRGETGGSEDRGIESSASNLIADAQQWATSNDAGEDAQIAFMNAGGVRADLTYTQSGDEGDGVVTYEEAFNVQPFSNILQTITLTGAQIDEVLEQQWNNDRLGARYRQHLGVSDGFTYTYDERQPLGSRIDLATITLNGEVLVPGTEYRVTVSQFLAEGGDDFEAFTQGTNVVGGGIDLEEFIAYLGANIPVDPPPTDRVTTYQCFDSAGTALPGAPGDCPATPNAAAQQNLSAEVGGAEEQAPEEQAQEEPAPEEEAEQEPAENADEAAALDPVAATEAAGVAVQLLSFNDYHGHLQSDTPGDIEGTPAGGSEYLNTHLQMLREGKEVSLTVAAGDIIGGSTFLSGLFRDEPAIEAMGTAALDVAGVGNHEFDRGVEELLRIQNGGCHPVDGCYIEGEEYPGASFQYLAANVIEDGTAPAGAPQALASLATHLAAGVTGPSTTAAGETVLPPYSIVDVTAEDGTPPGGGTPPPELPDTGGSSSVVSLLGIGLTVAGAALLFGARRTRSEDSEPAATT